MAVYLDLITLWSVAKTRVDYNLGLSNAAGRITALWQTCMDGAVIFEVSGLVFNICQWIRDRNVVPCLQRFVYSLLTGSLRNQK
jgi:hypothetical protein